MSTEPGAGQDRGCGCLSSYCRAPGVQTSELIGFLDIDKDSREAISHLYLITLKDRLLRCQRLRDELVTRANVAAEEIPKQRDARVRQIPHIVDLKGTAENFLYEAKNYLRDILELFRTAYSCKLKNASDFADLKDDGDSNVVKWAVAAFGKDDQLTKLLKTKQKWTAEVIQARNAVEHPGERSGTLTINNIRADPNNPDAYIGPTWQRTGRPESSVVADMDTELHNMLTLADDFLVDLIKRKSKSGGLIDFIEIPENQRDPICPIRLRVVLKREIETQIIARQHSNLRKKKLTMAQREEQLAQYKARAWNAKKLLRSQDRAWREKRKRGK